MEHSYFSVYRNNDFKQRVLWLSDIHYVVSYKEFQDGLDVFKSSFLEKCKEINDNKVIDIVLISGDIAQNGTTVEYEQFFNDFLEPLFEILTSAKLLVIPGNHDVNQSNIAYIESYLQLGNKNPNDKDYLDFIRKTGVSKVFEDYSNFFKTKKTFFPPKGVSNNYDENFYQGYYIDEKNKFLYVLVNSSWLSFVNESVKHYLENYVLKSTLPVEDKIKELENPDLSDEKRKEMLIKGHVSNIQKFTSEYGSQTLAIEQTFEDFNELKKIYLEYTEYFKICVVHHPENWLNWIERLKTSEAFAFLKHNSDVLCSGHEHVRHDFKQENRNKSNLHLKAGAFIEYNIRTNQCILKESIFTILDINGSKKNISEKKYKFVLDNTDILKSYWTYNKKEYNLLNNSNKNTSYVARVNKIKKHVNENNALCILQKYFNNEYIQELETDVDNPVIVDNLWIDKDNKRLFYYVNSIECYEDLKIQNNILNLYNIITLNQVREVFFFGIDIVIEEKEVYTEKIDKMLVLKKIKNKMERSFNSYRVLFFNNVEEVEYLEDVKFVSMLLPFWELEFLL